ncbi:MAG: ABC transporter ATP-binding protein [Paracoccaceae bacterium]|nr:ABC transporter ATP-binding protein [Paracoccaceae bacterium]
MRPSNVLELLDVYSSYGEIDVLRGINLEIGRGEIIALLGRNGMGKSTTIKSICGMLNPHKGQINFNGINVAGMPSFKIARMGLGLVPEGRRIFSNLTVAENLTGSSRKGYWDLPRILELFPVFEDKLSQNSSTLSGGEQQMLSIGRALMTNPSLILLDEATEGLSPLVSAQIWDVLSAISNEGISILIVDKLSKALKNLSNLGYIIERGETMWSGNLSTISDVVVSKFLGV